MSKPEIRLISHRDIDRQKWDECVWSATNRRIYSSSWYLDLVCPNWQGIVIGDYRAVMPIPFFRKYFISYIAQPIYAQQFDVFPHCEPTEYRQILDYLAARFNFIRLSLNSRNIESHKLYNAESKNNHILSLQVSYSQIESGYSINAKRNIKKAKNEVLIKSDVVPEQYMALKTMFPGVEKESLRLLQSIIFKAISLGKAKIYGAFTSDNQLCSASVFLLDMNQAIYINASSTIVGKEKSAAFAIVDQFICDYAEKLEFLDFEGSRNSGIARFYKGFGAVPEEYLYLCRNTMFRMLPYFKK